LKQVDPATAAVTDMGWTGSNQIDSLVFVPGPACGDLDNNGAVNLFDFAVFVDCVTIPGGTVTPDCRGGDLDRDRDIDLIDWAGFQRHVAAP